MTISVPTLKAIQRVSADYLKVSIGYLKEHPLLRNIVLWWLLLFFVSLVTVFIIGSAMTVEAIAAYIAASFNSRGLGALAGLFSGAFIFGTIVGFAMWWLE